MVPEKTLESPLDYKELKQSVLKEISPEYSLEGLVLAEPPVLWPSDAKRLKRLFRKHPDAGKD